ncbi:MAG: alcohol dehydrogenase catalytic domain-containing protein [Ignisphaera sp.]|uniref:Zinc-binding dehydrogenase n=1 Tax=Ignisphaera aggregans TaxID=334771 RepID=A0A7C4JLX9_9CREN
MKAAVLFSHKNLEILDVDIPAPPHGWALIEVELTGICGTDKAFYTGTYKLFKSPLIPGHEVVGKVVEGPKDLVGERVVPEINFSCWRCEYCRSGLYTHCSNKKTLGIDFDGGMAEYFIAPVEALHKFNGSPEKGIFVEPLAAILRALSFNHPKPMDRIAVIGSGAIAWLLVQVLRNVYKLDVDVIVRRNSIKARYFKRVADVVYVDEVKESYYDVVFEVSGDPKAIDAAVRIAKSLGVIHLKSTPGAVTQMNSTIAVVKELNIVCSRCGTFKEFEYAIKLLKENLVETILNQVYSLDNARKAFEEAITGQYFRIALRP